VLTEVVDGLAAVGLGVTALLPSPLAGADGNREFLARARRGAPSVDPATIDAVVQP
jgi:hypothetical protein